MFKMLATDLDGTLLHSDKVISPLNFKVLEELGKMGVIRVVATGRSRFSFKRVLPQEKLPFEYLVFSTGAGILDLNSGDIIRDHKLDEEDIRRIAEVLIAADVCFAIQAPVPDNHHFYYFEGRHIPEDFLRRRAAYQGYDQALESIGQVGSASQFLVFLNGGMDEFENLASRLPAYHIIRTTSPMDHKTIWMEVFPSGVSKGSAIQWLAGKHGMEAKDVTAIGNDYNDIQMLKYAGQAFVTANAPPDLRKRFKVLCHHNEDVLLSLKEYFSL